MTIGEFAEAVATYGLVMGGWVTSWGRTKHHNTTVGGVPYSAHRFWRGCDMLYDDPPPREERVETGRRLGLLVIIEGDHDHLQPLDWSKG